MSEGVSNVPPLPHLPSLSLPFSINAHSIFPNAQTTVLEVTLEVNESCVHTQHAPPSASPVNFSFDIQAEPSSFSTTCAAPAGPGPPSFLGWNHLSPRPLVLPCPDVFQQDFHRHFVKIIACRKMLSVPDPLLLWQPNPLTRACGRTCIPKHPVR